MRRRELVTRWRSDLAQLERAHEDAIEPESTVSAMDASRIEGMIAAYRRILTDAA